ncbi:MAG: DUF1559 domain-containing protein [Armatimonadota bacterium]
MFQHKWKCSGFTLIELLVVIAIIAILAAILFPVFAQAREKARQTTCQSNLKQLGMTVTMYSQDWEGYIPACVASTSGITWITIIAGCLEPGAQWDRSSGWVKGSQSTRSIFKCPSSPTDYGTTSESRCGVSIGYNRRIGLMDTSTGIFAYPLIDLNKQNSIFILFADISNTDPWRSFEVSSQLAGRHNGGCNLAFADGHAKWYSKQEMLGLNYTNGCFLPNR